MRLLPIGIVLLGITGHAAAQQTRFDVASVKQCRDENDIGPGRLIKYGDRLQLPCFPLILILTIAFGITVDVKWSRFPSPSFVGPASLHEMVFYTVEAM